MSKLAGKTFLIAGASSGIGRNIAEYLTNVEKANVILVARREEKLVSLKETLPGQNYAFPCDLSRSENIRSLFDFLVSKEILIDGMVYCAGVAPLYKIEENNEEQTLKAIKINALGFLELGKYMISSECIKNGASIVAMSSMVSETVTNRQSVYAGSKAMLNTFVKYMAKETLGKMRVNAVLPGIVETEMYKKLSSSSVGYEENIKKNCPLGVIPPEKVSKLVTYLLSDDAEFMTGSLIVMDGGYFLK